MTHEHKKAPQERRINFCKQMLQEMEKRQWDNDNKKVLFEIFEMMLEFCREISF